MIKFPHRDCHTFAFWNGDTWYTITLQKCTVVQQERCTTYPKGQTALNMNYLAEMASNLAEIYIVLIGT